ncbi:MAG: hypothetical protein H6697_02615 [Myxococcales bacterium]|nr:hypothetical protein [Myxococcales bacterium]MCB9521344.1 hypothetical protein [Myxococcales bacterium]
MPQLLITLLVLLVAAPALGQERPGPARISATAMANVAAGTPYVAVTQEGNDNRAELVAVIDAPPAEVWAVIMAYEVYESWFPDQREASVVSSSGRSRVLSGTTAVPILRDRTYQLNEQSRTSTNDAGQTVYIDTWDYIAGSGNLESSTGFWYVYPYDDAATRTVVRMVVQADLGIWLPSAILNWGTRRMLPGIAEGIQARCDAT